MSSDTLIRPRSTRVAPPGRPPRRRRAALGRPPRRLRVGLAVVVALLLVVAGRLVQLQGIDGRSYAAAAEKQRLRTQELPAVRGQVLDRDGNAFAITVDVRGVTADPTLVEDPRATSVALAPLLGEPADGLQQELSRRDTRFVYLAHQLEPAVAAKVKALDLGGIFLVPEAARVYPGHDLAANVVGFVGADGHGLAGVESAYDRLLSGRNGSETVEVDGKGRQIPQGEHREADPVAGSSVRLTIDRDVQYVAQQVLGAQVQATGADSGSVVVMDPKTGDVLALATAPTFDSANPTAGAPARRGDSPVTDVYEPGSVNKVITAAAALEQGVVQPMTPVVVPPSILLGGKNFTDAHAHGTETLTFTGVIAESSNIGTIEVAQKLGRQRLYDALRAFGFGSRTGIGLPGESPGIVPRPADWSGSSDGTIPIGQGIAVTAVQVASVYATVANGGVRMTPRVIDATVAPDGTASPLPVPAPQRVISAKTAGQLALILEQVTGDDGTAPLARIAGYRIAGKTGTARRVDPATGSYKPGSYSASFAGFAPADAPQLVVSVVLHDPHNGLYGGTVSAPVFHDVMSYALQKRAIPPTGATTPAAQLSLP